MIVKEGKADPLGYGFIWLPAVIRTLGETVIE
jgi:hypothetical protein